MKSNIDNEETIRDIAIKLMDAKIKSSNNSRSNTSCSLFILGSKGCGKTSAINKFLDKDYSQKETLSLEYTFGRKNGIGQFVEKNVCHVWELGGDIQNNSDAVGVPLKAPNILQMTLIIMLDLTQPATLWVTLETCVDTVRTSLETRKDPRQPEERVGGADEDATRPFPMPILLVGGKYDIFKTLDLEYKKTICKTLREAARLLGAGLFFYSGKDQGIVKKWKEILNYIGFGIGSPMKGSSVDVSRPLSVAPGADSWSGSGTAQSDWETAKRTFTSRYPQRSLGTAVPEDPSLEPGYRDPFVDSLRIQKDEQLKLSATGPARRHLQ